MDSVSLVADRVGKAFGARRVFANLSFRIETGQVVAIVGPNGSGKTTLLRVIAGLVRPTVGHVRIERGREVLTGDARRAALGMSAPDMPLYAELTAIENIEFVARVRGLRWERSACADHVARFGLAGREDDALSSFSSGMRRRAGLAAAVIGNPPVLLLDEPGANLDDAGNELVRAVVDEQRSRGITLLATNVKEEADHADSRIVMG